MKADLSTAPRPARRGYTLAALAIAALLGVNTIGAAHAAAPITPQAALVRLLTAPKVQADWFADSFLSQVSVGQVQQVIDSTRAMLGRYKSVQAQPDGSYLVVFAKGSLTAHIALDAQGRIVGLLFSQPKLTGSSLASAMQAFKALPGSVSVYIAEDGLARAALDEQRPLGVGSSFKLAVLAALQAQIKAGKLSWSQVVTLKAADRSLPSGLLQDWPTGSPLTVATLASLMISQSDNTAADTLIHLVGRDAIDALIPARVRPIATTHEFFVLKDPAHKALHDAYLHAAPTGRLAILKRADALALPSPSLFDSGPVATDIEWFFTTPELCGLMQQVHTLPLMGINPGLASRSDWASVAYKGGSEPGVLNLTTMVTSHSGKTYCVSATWNNTAALDQTRFEAMYSTLLGALT